MWNILEGKKVGISVLRHPLEIDGQRAVSGKPRRGGELPELRHYQNPGGLWTRSRLSHPDSVSSSAELSSGGGWQD